MTAKAKNVEPKTSTKVTEIESITETQARTGDSDPALDKSKTEKDCERLFQKLTSDEVDYGSIRQYLNLDTSSIGVHANSLAGVELVDVIDQELEKNHLTERTRKRLLVSMNRATLVELATVLGCYDPNRIQSGDTSEWRCDPLRGPVIDVLLEIHKIFLVLGPQSEKLIEKGIGEHRPAIPCPPLPCSLLKVIRYVTKVDRRYGSKCLKDAFSTYVSTLATFPPGEPSRLCIAVRAGLPFPDEKSRPDKPQQKSTEGPLEHGRIYSMAVTEPATVGWLLEGFYRYWSENRTTIRKSNTKDLQSESVSRKKRQESGDLGNQSQEDTKWREITRAFVEFHVGRDLAETSEDRERMFKEFFSDAANYGSSFKASSRHTRKKIQVFLTTLLNQVDLDPEQAAAQAFKKIRDNKKPEFKAVGLATIRACWEELEAANLIGELDGS